MRIKKPPIFESSNSCIWTEEYISERMLEAHLNPDIDAASHKIETIEGTVKFWLEKGLIKPGDRVLDLGCGPGLYAERLAIAGMRVVGIDQSEAVLSHAMKQAKQKNLSIEYRCMNFLELKDEGKYDAVLQVFGEFCTLPDDDRDLFLAKIYRAVKPGGIFLMDVSTRKLRVKDGLKNNWYVNESGFWRPGPHLVLEMGFDYPDNDIWLDQYIVVDQGGNTTTYRCWFHDYSLETLTPVVESAGFDVGTVWGDLAGAPYNSQCDWITVSLKKTGSCCK
ncbi:class I SAM-dependent methyltransferase [Desulfotruncus arcticus]|nr:class I SAM-dependent methyltransferase [Desulfotruncus arcticus]